MNAPLFFVGSLPFTDIERALRFVEKSSPNLPFLPQLPRANPKEAMIAQALRGMQLGQWNAEVSCAFEPFLKLFKKAERVKIQIAGPYTVAWFSSKAYGQIEPAWKKMWEGVFQQIKSSGFLGKIWLQLDEPIWSQVRPLPPTYSDLVEFLSKDNGVSVGIHSCASERPLPEGALADQCSFFSFDYLRASMTGEEKLLWRRWLNSKKILVEGIFDRQTGPQWKKGLDPLPDNVWISTPCGLFEWSEDEVETLGKSRYCTGSQERGSA